MRPQIPTRRSRRPTAHSPEPDAEAFVEAEPEATERTHFEALERETTQPVRRYFEPRRGTEFTPADLGHAVDYEVPVERVALPASDAEQPQAEAAPLEPWPDPLPVTSESESEQRVAESYDRGIFLLPPVKRSPPPRAVADPVAFEPFPASETGGHCSGI